MDLTGFLEKTFLFEGVSREQIQEIISKFPPALESYNRTETIATDCKQKRRVGFVLSGKCEVIRSKADGSHTVLNVLTEHGSFGILSVVSEEDCSTEIYVTNNSTVLYFDKAQIDEIVKNYSQISLNLIKFLANRISFLNKKIETFSGTRVENRLASYLLDKMQKTGCESFSFNLKKCSEAINAGRASVYRIIGSFTNEGLITLVDKKIIIHDREGLERMKK